MTDIWFGPVSYCWSAVRHYVSSLLKADCKHFPEHLCLLRMLFPNAICGADYY